MQQGEWEWDVYYVLGGKRYVATVHAADEREAASVAAERYAPGTGFLDVYCVVDAGEDPRARLHGS